MFLHFHSRGCNAARFTALALAFTVATVVAAPAFCQSAPILSTPLIQSAAAAPQTFDYGAILAQVLTTFAPIIAGLIVSFALKTVAQILGQPAADAAKAAGLDKDLDDIVMAAMARTSGVVASEKLDVSKINPVVNEALAVAKTAAPALIDSCGGMDGLRTKIAAYLSRKGYLPPEASAIAGHFG